MQTIVYAFYKFTTLQIARLQPLRAQLLSVLRANRVRGTLLLAEEGINGTICGPRNELDTVLAWLTKQPEIDGLEPHESSTDVAPFKRTKVKLKQEIVTLGVPDLNLRHRGVAVAAHDWNTLLEDEEVLVVDTRNQYEVKIGSFQHAIHPHTTNFRQFPSFAKQHLNPRQHKSIAMYCTGGIRCEKSTAYLKQHGFERVFHLQGGILNYLAQVPTAESRWRGECFVFDERVSVDHQLKPGSYAQCHACRQPISATEQQSEHYAHGVSCPHCYARTSATDKLRFLQREKQVALAAGRGTAHLGTHHGRGRDRFHTNAANSLVAVAE